MTGQGIELGTVGQDGLEPELFDLGQGLGSAEDPSRHHAGCWRLRGDRPWRGALLSQVGADPAVAASIAQGNNLFPELPGVGAALVPAFVQVGLVLVEDGGPVVPPLTTKEVFRLRSVGEALDGAVGHVQLAPDGTAAVAGFQQRVDSGVPGSDAVGESLAPPWKVRLLDGRRRFVGLPLAIGYQHAKALAVAGDSPLSSLPKVVPQMPAVGDLRRLGRPGCGAFREERRAIPRTLAPPDRLTRIRTAIEPDDVPLFGVAC
jgi:hypothetical protein